MTGASENAYLVRVRAQVMCRDEGTGGWMALGGGGLLSGPISASETGNQYEIRYEDRSTTAETDPERCPYVHLSAVHEYAYPNVTSEITTERAPSTTNPPLLQGESGSIKKCSYGGPPPLPDKKPTDTFHARLKCRHCHEWYLESANRAGACEFAPDCCRTCIDCVSCIKCAQCMLYHCMSDAEGEFAMHPCACNKPDDACAKRWIGVALLSLLVPCLCCYLPLRCAHRGARALRLAGGHHAPQRN
ncbi:PREDICTED: sprouty-related, EVH1 domain-containing protein 2 [Papilio polytes]|uniref:sprouty-related, EVH1 domain-containing protein 2 n=1 Tax=Papilio polytes TaxID=76194 RepID=UPI0006766DCE|nr:PREDICTED: sprouty-related, EVH1 domain-containing protein 2 [Papilio polytes]